jgi:hypothetical protein
MSDIATLGLQIDSSQATTAATALDKLTASAGKTTPYIAALEKAAARAKTTLADIERVAAPATSRVTGLGNAIELTGRRSGALSSSMTNLSFQINDIVSGLAMGQSPFQIMAQQGGQVFQVWQTNNSVFKETASVVGRLLTPARLATGSMAVLGTTALLAYTNWLSAQREVQLGLLGIGRASGAVAGDIHQISDATASLRTLSVSEARETATALASTGKIGVANIELLTASTKNFAVALGVDVPDAAKLIAKIFSNPTEGAKELNARLGGLDATTLKYIETLEQQGERQKAIRVLAEATLPTLAKASELTGVWARGWNVVSNSASNAYNSISKALGGTLSDESEAALNKRRKELEDILATLNQFTTKGNLAPDLKLSGVLQELFAINDELMKIQESRRKALGIDAAATTLQVAPLITALAPASELIRNVNANLELMAKVMSDPAFEAFRQKIGDALPQAFARLSNQAAALKLNPGLADPITSAIQNLTTQNRLLTDSSPAMRKRVEYEIAYNDAVRQGASAQEAKTIATLRSNQAGGGAAADLQIQQQKISLLGTLATVQDTVRSKQNEINLANIAGVHITDDQVAALKRLAELQALTAKAQRAGQFGIFDQGAQSANAGLEIRTLIDDGTIKNANDYAAAWAVITKRIKDAGEQAAVVRSPFEQVTRYALDGMNATKQFDQFAVSGLGNIENSLVSFANGTKTAKDAFADMATAVLSDLERMMIRMMITAPLAQALGGAFGMGGGLGGLVGMTSAPGAAGVVGANGPFVTPTFATGGFTGSGGKFEAAGIVHRGEYVLDANTTRRIGVPVLDRLRGYADGGFVPGFAPGGVGDGDFGCGEVLQ